jgi:hypothetical protein
MPDDRGRGSQHSCAGLGLGRWRTQDVMVRDRENEPGKDDRKGDSTLRPIKKMWWLTALFTGARMLLTLPTCWPSFAVDGNNHSLGGTSPLSRYFVNSSASLSAMGTMYGFPPLVVRNRIVFFSKSTSCHASA